ncbi:hypothetical protein MTsPCn5_39470 [Croceitalea sp. MTPC5]|uniref:nuclear transport factor 2 family protein n=1 Tax=Croceitalea sp. MTPC5 TaxID=3056565 RepID=UPI002B3BCCCD|nr:hypothetical protein MTsPCn5_39470 [Croceitalea sp. MTPC5]
MTIKKPFVFILLFLFCVTGCQEVKKQGIVETANEKPNSTEEKKAILKTLNDETKAAFERDYDAWQKKWVHDPNITKTYIDFEKGTFSEALGWNEISQFVKTFMDEHPEPEPLPELLNKIEVRLYGNGAWVTYGQQDSLRGRKRETRLMEKIDGEWKIAGMQTTIYGFDSDKN